MLGSLLAVASLVALVYGHGRVLDPAGRGSAWRVGYSTSPNYDDDGLNCGGFDHHWRVNNGLCGVCGDPWDAPEPRDHELGGKYGTGVITGEYTMGSVIKVVVQLTAYHQGYWVLKICPDPSRNDQECFDQYVLELEDGGTQFYPNKGSATYELSYRLPGGLTCDHCVLQWRYTAGNNWGVCSDGKGALGCGNQENFGACSDIRIEGSNSHYIPAVNAADDIPSPLLHYLSNGYFNVQQGLMHLVWTGKSSPKPLQTTSKPVPKKKYKDRHRQQSKKKRKPVKKTRPEPVKYWSANSIGPDKRSEYYKHNLDPKLPMPSYYF